MFRRSCLALVIAVMAGSAWIDVLACGDKFLRPGRSARFRKYASVHPSAILVYAPRWTAKGIKDFERMLQRAGHSPVTVTSASALAQAVASGDFKLLITGYSHAGTVREQLQRAAGNAAVVPVIYKRPRSEEADAIATYRYVLNPEKMNPFDALDEIDRALGRVKETRPRAGND